MRRELSGKAFNVLDSAIRYPSGSTTLDPRVDTTRITLGESLIFDGIGDVKGVPGQRCTVGGGQAHGPLCLPQSSSAAPSMTRLHGQCANSMSGGPTKSTAARGVRSGSVHLTVAEPEAVRKANVTARDTPAWGKRAAEARQRHATLGRDQVESERRKTAELHPHRDQHSALPFVLQRRNWAKNCSRRVLAFKPRPRTSVSGYLAVERSLGRVWQCARSGAGYFETPPSFVRHEVQFTDRVRKLLGFAAGVAPAEGNGTVG